MIVNHEGNSPTGGIIGAPPCERHMDIAEAGEASGTASQMTAKTMPMPYLEASEQRERTKDGPRLRSETSKSGSALGDSTRHMEKTPRQQVGEVTQLHKTLGRLARILETQWLGMTYRLGDRETK